VSVRAGALLLGLAGGLLGACHRESGGAPGAQGVFGPAGRVLVGSGSLWLVESREADQAGVDANGDGDASDVVLVLVDLARDRLLSPGLALGEADGVPPLLACDGHAAAFAVDEAAQGGRDLNGDGDALDRVIHVYDAPTGEFRNLGLAVQRIVVGGSLVAVAVDEAAHGGADLDGDGDATGSVLAVHDLRDGTTTVLTLRDSSPLLVHADSVALRLAERVGNDLTGDGDDSDQAVFEVYDGSTRLLQNTTLALAGDSVAGVGGTFGVLVSEAAQGRGDLSGDGDADDWVFHVFDPRRSLSVNLGLSPPLHPASAVDGHRYLVFAREGPSAVDFNHDGDTEDVVVQVFDPEKGQLFLTGLASLGAAALFGEFVGVSVSETMQGATDLDGDGETDGNVVHVFDLGTGFARNLGLDAFVLRGGTQRLFLVPLEKLRNDWNGDGDFLDQVFADWAPSEGPARLGAAVGALLDVAGDLALLQVSEGERGVDVTGDGDRSDLVLELFDGATGATRSLGVAVGSAARLAAGGVVLALVDEEAQGRDLNGDGDRADEVVYRSR